MTKQTLILTGLMAGLFFQTAYAAETPKRSSMTGVSKVLTITQ
ncbi:hypothetical protein [Neisseria weixii]|nr:hypothetical protein [Neisseria weixii]